MATEHKVPKNGADRSYSNCVITPMSENGDGKPHFKLVHVMDALIVGGIVFFSTLLGGALPAIISGSSIYLSASQVASRLVTAFLAFGLTFFAQWARYRGIKVVRFLSGGK